MKKIILYIVAFLLFSIVAHPQSISNSYVNPGYGIITNDLSLTYSIGDLFYGELNNEQLIISAMFPAGDDEPVGIPKILEDKEIRIYPNPCRKTIYMRTNIKDALYFILYTLNGVLLKHRPISIDQGIDVRHLPNGLYIYKITDTDQNLYFVDKLIKSN